MQRTHFDFDVITGPVPPRPMPKPASKPEDGGPRKPPTGAEEGK